MTHSNTMTDDQALGMFVGLFIGDAMGAPLEFTEPNMGEPVRSMIGGGVHDVTPGEWTDDGAMAMCIAKAYLRSGKFDAALIQHNFIRWSKTGEFGTRNRVFDIGITVSEALRRAQDLDLPYVGSAYAMASGNGSIMRMAPCIAWNRHSLGGAIGESVAQALLTHGSGDTVTYTSALAHELWAGQPLAAYDSLRNRPLNNSGYVADTYASAWHSVTTTRNFEDAVVDAINRGGDADTVGAVAGMLAGRIYGFAALEHHADTLVKADLVICTGRELMTRRAP
jgi:ADP-ribosyl-[dinitrogen reductase] hydrolase